MTKPTISPVDDRPVVSRAITPDLRAHYSADYRIMGAMSGAEAVAVLAELTLRDRSLALGASDQQTSDTTAIALEAINRIGLDHYLLEQLGYLGYQVHRYPATV